MLGFAAGVLGPPPFEIATGDVLHVVVAVVLIEGTGELGRGSALLVGAVDDEMGVRWQVGDEKVADGGFQFLFRKIDRPGNVAGFVRAAGAAVDEHGLATFDAGARLVPGRSLGGMRDHGDGRERLGSAVWENEAGRDGFDLVESPTAAVRCGGVLNRRRFVPG